MERELAETKNKICSPQGDEHLISLPEFLKRFETDENGLSEQKAAQRLRECGPNVLEEAGKESTCNRQEALLL